MKHTKVIAISARSLIWFLEQGAKLRTYYREGIASSKVYYRLSGPTASITIQESAVRALLKRDRLVGVRWSGWTEYALCSGQQKDWIGR